jgi:hypothetical protein
VHFVAAVTISLLISFSLISIYLSIKTGKQRTQTQTRRGRRERKGAKAQGRKAINRVAIESMTSYFLLPTSYFLLPTPYFLLPFFCFMFSLRPCDFAPLRSLLFFFFASVGDRQSECFGEAI